MLGLFDRDVFIKLVCCDLWHEALEALDVTHPYRLASTSSRTSNEKLVTRRTLAADRQAAFERMARIVEETPAITDEMITGLESTPGFVDLADIDNIDAGEQVLAALLIRDPDKQVLVTGDKRFVRAFREGAPAHWERVSTKIISFEMCLLAIVDLHGFECVCSRASAIRECDHAMRLALREDLNEEHFTDALNSFNPCRVEAPDLGAFA